MQDRDKRCVFEIIRKKYTSSITISYYTILLQSIWCVAMFSYLQNWPDAVVCTSRRTFSRLAVYHPSIPRFGPEWDLAKTWAGNWEQHPHSFHVPLCTVVICGRRINSSVIDVKQTIPRTRIQSIVSIRIFS